MNNCNRLIPAIQRLSSRAIIAVPARNIFCRRSLAPWNLIERQIADMDRQFARLEREINSAFRDRGFPGRIRSIFEPSVAASSLSSQMLANIEAHTSPVSESGKSGKYSIKIDVGEGFSPEDIKVNLKDRLLTIHAKMEKKSEDGRIYQEVSRSFTLPEIINPEEVKSLFTPEGILTIEAPLPEVEAPQPKEISIPVERKNN